MAHPRELPLATPEQSEKYMNEAGDFVFKNLSVADDSLLSLKRNNFTLPQAMNAASLVMYMSIFTLAEFHANKDGFTLRDYKMAEKVYADPAAFVAGPETRQ